MTHLEVFWLCAAIVVYMIGGIVVAALQAGQRASDDFHAALAQKKQSFLITNCVFFGDAPAPHESWPDFFDHAIQTCTFADVCISASPRREWQGLTEEEILKVADEHPIEGFDLEMLEFVRAIEQKLKEKNYD